MKLMHHFDDGPLFCLALHLQGKSRDLLNMELHFMCMPMQAQNATHNLGRCDLHKGAWLPRNAALDDNRSPFHVNLQDL